VDVGQTIEDGHLVDLFVVRALDVTADEELVDRVAEPHLVAVDQALAANALLIDERAVGGAQVFHVPIAVGALGEAGVLAGGATIVMAFAKVTFG